MTTLLALAGMLGRGESPAERARRRLMAMGAALATWFLFGGANVLALHGKLDERFGPVGDPGTRGGTAFAFGLLVLPVAAFLYQSGRLAAADRERRLAALRLAGATPREVRLLGALETTRAALIGTVAGAAVYLLVQWAVRRMFLSPGSPADVGVPPALCLAAMAIVVIAAAVSGLLAGRQVVATPLGVVRRAGHRPPRPYGYLLLAPPSLMMLGGFLADSGILEFLRPVTALLIYGGGLLLVAGLLLSSSRLIWSSARITGARARSAETLLAARALQADARPWGRTMSVVGLAVAIGSGAGWMQSGLIDGRGGLEPFWLTSFVLVDLALLVGISVAAAALLVHQAEYLLEHGPVLAALHAAGTSERELHRVLTRQALIAATPVCAVASLVGFLAMAAPTMENKAWLLWPVARAVLMAGLGVLAAYLVATASRRRLRRTVAAGRLRTE
jgi:hypothetical protein